jgi:hypothetical protein
MNQVQVQAHTTSARVSLQRESLFSFLKRAPALFAGMAATFGMMLYGIFSMLRGNAVKSGRGMEMRVTSQALTVAIILGYATYEGNGPNAFLNQKVRKWRGLPLEENSKKTRVCSQSVSHL